MNAPRNQRPWALVTGASSGIGEEFCRQLAARGYRLVLLARREDRLRALAERLHASHGTECRIEVADLAEPAAGARLANRLERDGVDIDFLVNNAGYGLPGKLVSVPWEEHERFLQVMVTAVCDLAWRFMPGMVARGRGCIVNVASVAGLTSGTAGHTLYGASKAFLVRFSESLAQEGAPHGVRVSALCPGFTYSEFHDVTGTREQVSRLPSWLWLEAEDVVADGIDAVLGTGTRVVTVPGAVYKVLVWLSGAFPPFGRWLANRNAHRFRRTD